MLPLFWSFIAALVLGSMLLAAFSDTHGDATFPQVLETRLRPVAIVLFAGSGLLHLPLLAAPWSVRRKVAALDAFDVDYAGRQVQRTARR